MDMKEIMTEYKQQQEIASRDPMNYAKTFAGIAAAANAAKARMVELKDEYAKSLLNGAVCVIVTGTNGYPDQFAKIAEADFNAIVLDAQELYKRITAQVEPNIGPSREFGAHHAGVLISALRDIGSEMQLREMPAPKHQVLPAVLKDREEVEDYVSTAIRSSSGDDLNKLYLSNQAVNKTLAKEITNPTIPILIVHAIKEEGEAISKMFARPTHTLNINKEPDAKSVETSFVDIKKKLHKH